MKESWPHFKSEPRAKVLVLSQSDQVQENGIEP